MGLKLKAEYNYKPYRCSKGTDILVEVLMLEDFYSEIRGENYHNHVRTSKLKPYLDPDADGSQWLFLGHVIMEQSHPGLQKYAIYSQDGIVTTCGKLSEAKELIVKQAIKLKNKKEDKY